MLSKTKSAFIISLQRKKTRDEERLFVVEGDKIVKEFLLAGVGLKTLVANPIFVNAIPSKQKNQVEEIITVTYEELKKISSLKTPHNALAIVKMPNFVEEVDYSGGLCAALDCVQDPGNLGTIIRTAAWFGIKKIYCSHNCVDVYNPKVLQASMGAILHVEVHYTDLTRFFSGLSAKNVSIYGATLDGISIYDQLLNKEGIILLGNESKGISEELLSYVTDKIIIPYAGKNAVPGIDSLNVSMAASVIFSEFSRR